MKTNRRSFLKHSCIAALSTAVLAPSAAAFASSGTPKAAALPGVSADPLSRLTRADFAAYIGEVMPVTDSSGCSAALQLIEANDLKHRENVRRGYTGESYSLIFESTGKRKVGENVFRFDHDGLGSFSLLVVAVGRSGNRFEAVVNRVAPPGR